MSTLDNKSKTLLERDPANPNADSSSTGVVEQPRSTIFRAVRPRPLAVRLLKRPSQPKRSGLQQQIKPLRGQSQPSHPFQRQKPGHRVRLLTGPLQLSQLLSERFPRVLIYQLYHPPLCDRRSNLEGPSWLGLRLLIRIQTAGLQVLHHIEKLRVRMIAPPSPKRGSLRPRDQNQRAHHDQSQRPLMLRRPAQPRLEPEDWIFPRLKAAMNVL